MVSFIRMDKPVASKSLASRRIAAALLDFALVVLLDFVLCLPSIAILVNTMVDPSFSVVLSNAIIAFVTGAFVLGVDVLYLAIYPGFKKGQTLGLRFFDLALCQEDGSPLSSRQYVVRATVLVLLAFSTIGISLLVEGIVVGLSKGHRSFTDACSKAYIIDVSTKENN